MSEEIISSYVDRVKFGDDTSFILAEIKKGADAIAAISNAKVSLRVDSSFKTLSEGAEKGTKAINDLQLTTANYQKVLAVVAGSVDILTDAQKANLKIINDQYVQEERQRSGAKETVKLIATEIAQNDKLAAGREEAAKSIAITAAQIKSEKLERDRLAKVLVAENNSREKAQAIIDLLINKGKKLNLETEQGRRVNESYNATIAKQNEFILKNADVETKRVKNIGNYSKSAQIVVDALERERAKLVELEKMRVRVANAGAGPIGFAGRGNQSNVVTGNAAGAPVNPQFAQQTKAATIEAEKLEQQISQTRTVIEGFARVTAQPQFLNVAGKVGDATAEVRFFTKALIDLERNGLGNSAAANDLRKNLAGLTDDIADARAEVKALSSDTRGMDLFAGSVSFAADAMQTFAGAAVLAGASEEDVAEQTRTLVAIQSVANGVKGIANELTTRGTAANKLYAFAQSQVAIATNASATATARLSAALVTIGIGALIIGIGLLISNYQKIKEVLTGVTKEKKILNDITDKSIEKASEEVSSLDILYKKTQSLNLSVKERTDAAKELQKTYPITFGNLTTEAILAGEAADAYDRLRNSIIAKARTEAIKETFGEKAKENLKSEIELQKDLQKEQQELNRITKSSIPQQDTRAGNKEEGFFIQPGKSSLIGAANTRIANAKAAIEKNKRAFELENKFLLDGLSESEKQAKISIDEENKRKENQQKEKKPKGNKESKKFNDDLLKDQLEAEKKNAADIRQLAIDNANERIRINQLIVDDQTASLTKQLTAIESIEATKLALVAEELSNAVASETVIEKGKRVVIEKSNEAKLLAERQYQIKVKIIREEGNKSESAARTAYVAELKTAYDASQEEVIKSVEESAQAERDAAEITYNKSVIDLNTRLEKGLISQEQYNKEREKLDVDYQVESLRREIKYQKDLIEISDLPANKKAEALRKLNSLELQLSESTKNKYIKNEAEKLAATQKTLDEIGKVSGQVFSFIDGLLGASATNQKNKLKDQTDEQERKAARDIELVNASAASEENKASKILIINARLIAQKDIAAQKERKINQEQARFAKAVAIFNIILSTTQAVIKAYTEGDPYTKVARAILAGVAGAAQLAVAIATPIPRFFKGKGRGNNYEGPALVNDHPDGRTTEVIEHADGSVEMPSGRNILTDIKSSDIIHPDKDAWMNAIYAAAHRDSMVGVKVILPSDNSANIDKALKDYSKSIVNAINNKKEFSLGATDKGMVALHKWGASQVRYVNENTNW